MSEYGILNDLRRSTSRTVFPSKPAGTATVYRKACLNLLRMSQVSQGTEDSVIGIIKFKAVKRLLKIFAHETVQKFDGFTDREATHYFQPEQEKVEANFMRLGKQENIRVKTYTV